ncbi:RiPP maturation radical SAM C-methyltransferase [Bradyrhizobium brasilense]|uniref:RiPP maturation radical SAM C-methyltransferase n=1 Tax=Bradyrhizobium brasilense TaxID=1419277 RepID=UPI001E5975AA|nr:RiPP maturation radical SAM C-methyltransferase [Bradyrhizobium brasilense]MCC8969770.1 RiPP maturation radical SAM protein 1 [Bradyrhizobium brasilense]
MLINATVPIQRTIALINMPLASATRPSIQLGLLSAIVESVGVRVDQHYFNLDLARELGADEYEELCRHRGNMTGEWLFSVAAFGAGFGPTTEDYLAAFPSEFDWLAKVNSADLNPRDLREQVLPDFIERMAASVDWSAYSLVGFTSTFQQNIACLALARRIKERFPDVPLLFGGSNTNDTMGVELIRSFPYVDYVLRGEADKTFPQLLQWLFEGGRGPAKIAGLVSRNSEHGLLVEPEAPVASIADNPIPNYRPYFQRLTELKFGDMLCSQVVLPFESSRGCWWGAKQHCTFCGLNGATMTYRKKRGSTILAELKELASRHWVTNFEAVDNIVDHKQFDDLFTTIREQQLSFRFFYEIKANISRHDLETLAAAGVRAVQPGIESLNSRILKLMKKGAGVLHNVRCLKWARYYRMSTMWNILYGFPGETKADYEAQLDIIDKIQHLQPPMSASRIWLERFAPYFKRREEYAITEVLPTSSYRYAYPSQVNLSDIAYFFDYIAKDTLPDEDQQPLVRAVQRWKDSWQGPNSYRLDYRRIGNDLLLDRGRGTDMVTTRISGLPATAYLMCEDAGESPDRIAAMLRTNSNYVIGVEDVRDILDLFCEHGVMLSDEGRYLSLALPIVD